MIVTTCLIPILVVLFFLWLMKTLFSVPIIIPAPPLKPKKRKRSGDGDQELMLPDP